MSVTVRCYQGEKNILPTLTQANERSSESKSSDCNSIRFLRMLKAVNVPSPLDRKRKDIGELNC